MNNVRQILFVSQGLIDETQALTQAMSLARNNQARLKALLICPALPKEMKEYREPYLNSLKIQLERAAQTARDIVKLDDSVPPLQIDIECADAPAINIIRHVLREAHDLVIKAAEPKEGGKGFKAIDMELLRKCPCPVWLTRPIERHRNAIRVAVAIDPMSSTPEGHDLSLQLLQSSRALADTCSGELHILSCWDYAFDAYLRDNVWIKVTDAELNEKTLAIKAEHQAAQLSLLTASGIQGKQQLHHLRGQAERIIPQFVAEQSIDILVMGTVARTGIAGFFIGNTAENIVQTLACSLLALKPNGFVSPVSAY
ncbi:universal stress protein [Aeromonas australiensis]|uniref:universal stress protein n=1 Tax=Aeromonas australiensis TaxID=1114880 RepID=UPI000589D377|nr:universal stress protein [Aeromonas australiensis]MCF3097380.1 universal stress protein [Aeromonas australiensis]